MKCHQDHLVGWLAAGGTTTTKADWPQASYFLAEAGDLPRLTDVKSTLKTFTSQQMVPFVGVL